MIFEPKVREGYLSTKTLFSLANRMFLCWEPLREALPRTVVHCTYSRRGSLSRGYLGPLRGASILPTDGLLAGMPRPAPAKKFQRLTLLHVGGAQKLFQFLARTFR